MKNPGFNFQNTYTNLPSCFFTETNAVSVKEPKLVILNEDLCKDIDLDFKLLQTPQSSRSDDNESPRGHSIGWKCVNVTHRVVLCIQ